MREGKYWDDAKGGWLDPVLVRKAREEEMQSLAAPRLRRSPGKRTPLSGYPGRALVCPSGGGSTRSVDLVLTHEVLPWQGGGTFGCF